MNFFFSSQIASNFVLNGGFETTFSPPWSREGSISIIETPLLKAPNGVKVLQAAGTASQSIKQFIPNLIYTLSFQLSGNPNDQRVYVLRVSIGDSTRDFSFTSSGNTAEDMKYELVGFDFPPTPSTFTAPTLTFQSLVDGVRGPIVDNVVITRKCIFFFFFFLFKIFFFFFFFSFSFSFFFLSFLSFFLFFLSFFFKL